MLRKWFSIALIAFSSQVFGLQDSVELQASSSHYIRDDLFVFLHAGPGRNYRILGSVEAGTPITIIQHNRETEFSEIREKVEGRTGWVETKFVSNQISRAEQLPIISQQLADSQASLQGLQSENSKIKQQLNDARQQLAKLTTQTENQTKEVNTLTAQLEAESKDEMIKWFTWGGIVAGGGVLLGVILTFLPKKRRREDTWM
ncbi:TIGR04211 family SH3 domain-containing protein [Alteromonas pelagimontana]|uniref:TIGR04211 family SH3 domain-containing protein n=1 Tax=Alteromonas pelagimontana TaxID=1858656 RepID=A0A6M4MB27_9ALTE|nr:TIGR04211 family SH3 domain-containing protein [Alteromonas pelagimontana]QJR80404.1 TIGR04211 family SH3 domain-containing protein [Alteromonas pelagimontana]